MQEKKKYKRPRTLFAKFQEIDRTKAELHGLLAHKTEEEIQQVQDSIRADLRLEVEENVKRDMKEWFQSVTNRLDAVERDRDEDHRQLGILRGRVEKVRFSLSRVSARA